MTPRRGCYGERMTMGTQEAPELQAVLEGVPLPADRKMLLEYARREDERAARRLEALPERPDAIS